MFVALFARTQWKALHHGADAEPIVEAYISGEIEATDIIVKIRALRGRRAQDPLVSEW
jgi:hypothetical protein